MSPKFSADAIIIIIKIVHKVQN